MSHVNDVLIPGDIFMYVSRNGKVEYLGYVVELPEGVPPCDEGFFYARIWTPAADRLSPPVKLYRDDYHFEVMCNVLNA